MFMADLSVLSTQTGLPAGVSVLTSVAMEKARAIELLGGTVTAAARAIGVTRSAVSQWPDELPPRISDRVLAALARMNVQHVADACGSPAAPCEPAAAPGAR
jgi:hypothetical protein